jgi:all-trans-retinol 13,14-reductase
MSQQPDASFDAVVIGSGIGGLACACALGRTGYKVLVLEQHFTAGGLTQTFSRNGFTWDVGVHYLGEMQDGAPARRILDWLSGGTLRFAPVGAVYDTVHLPGGFQIQFAAPEAALRHELRQRFPQSHAEIDAYFVAINEAARVGQALFAQRSMPRLLASIYEFWHESEIERWWGRTTETVLFELISDPQLRAVLAAQRGDYGPDPRESSFGMHATVTRHYFGGAHYPVNGAKAFADCLVPVIEHNGGQVRTRARVTEIIIENEALAGVRTKDGREWRCPLVFSDAGAQNTVLQLLPAACREAPWAREIASFDPSPCHVQLYLGLEGNVGALGATASNHWFYETLDLTKGLWRGPLEQPTAPALFVSFPSLKDTRPASAREGKHTAEVVVFTDWGLFRRWEDSKIGNRPAEYLDFKRLIEERLVAQFSSYFPALAPLIVYREVSTPLSTVAFTGAQQGGVYGLEASPRRFLSTSLRAKTPVPGLYLAGQDVASAGITGAMMGGVLAAAAVEPKLFLHVR